MSPDEDALLNGIAATPADDLPRLVYADWLEDHGQDIRAEFIRIQCEIARLEVGPRDIIDRNVHLWRRQQELLDGHADELFAGVPYRPRHQSPGPRFYRGFLDEVRLNQDEFRDHGMSMATMRPLPTSLTVSADATAFGSVNAASDAAHAVVTSLEFFGNFEPDLHTYLDYGRTWPRLRSLTSINIAVQFDDLVEMMRDHTPAIESLNLANNGLTDFEVILLLNAGVLQRLKHISLIENRIGDQAAIELADRLGNSPNLKELDLRRNGITEVGQRALLARLGSKVILF